MGLQREVILLFISRINLNNLISTLDSAGARLFPSTVESPDDKVAGYLYGLIRAYFRVNSIILLVYQRRQYILV